LAETRKLAAILAADVAGYSKLAGADEERTLARLRALRSDVIDPTYRLKARCCAQPIAVDRRLSVNWRSLLAPGLGLLDLCRKLEQEVLLAEAADKLHSDWQARL
jgi:hypothetical protein